MWPAGQHASGSPPEIPSSRIRTVRRLPRNLAIQAEQDATRTRAHSGGEQRPRHARDGLYVDGHQVPRRVRRRRACLTSLVFSYRDRQYSHSLPYWRGLIAIRSSAGVCASAGPIDTRSFGSRGDFVQGDGRGLPHPGCPSTAPAGQ